MGFAQTFEKNISIFIIKIVSYKYQIKKITFDFFYNINAKSCRYISKIIGSIKIHKIFSYLRLFSNLLSSHIYAVTVRYQIHSAKTNNQF